MSPNKTLCRHFKVLPLWTRAQLALSSPKIRIYCRKREPQGKTRRAVRQHPFLAFSLVRPSRSEMLSNSRLTTRCLERLMLAMLKMQYPQ